MIHVVLIMVLVAFSTKFRSTSRSNGKVPMKLFFYVSPGHQIKRKSVNGETGNDSKFKRK